MRLTEQLHSTDEADVALLGTADDVLGSDIAAGDLTGDGTTDLLIGAWSAAGRGEAYIVSPGSLASGDVSARATGILVAEAEGDGLGISIDPLGDVDGDGYEDLVVGAFESGLAGARSGVAYLVHGPVSGRVGVDTVAAARLLGTAAQDVAGYNVAGVGDVDADGVLDVAVTRNDYVDSYAGVISVVPGDLTGDHSLADAPILLRGDWPGAATGASLAGPGDLNGDGVDDLVIGAPNARSRVGTEVGAVYVVYGPLSGDGPLSAADARMEGVAPGGSPELNVSAPGDMDDDGLPDLLVAIDAYSGSRGGAWLIGGADVRTAPVRTLASASFVGSTRQSRLSAAEGPGDVDGDGVPDLLVGAYGWRGNRGVSLLYYGPFAGAYAVDDADEAWGGNEDARVGAQLAGIGDADADGRADFAISAVFDDAGGDRAGAAYVFYGGGL